VNPIVVETFRGPDNYILDQLAGERWQEPDCFNGIVRVERYRVTVEKIEEPKEVLRERLQKLWRECDNHHHMVPIRKKAEELGVELIHDEWGKGRKKR